MNAQSFLKYVTILKATQLKSNKEPEDALL